MRWVFREACAQGVGYGDELLDEEFGDVVGA